MPNWTSCCLEAPKDVIDKYLSEDENGELRFDFKKVISRPEIYDDHDLVAGSDVDWCVYWYMSERGKNKNFREYFSGLDTFLIDDSEYCKRSLENCLNNSDEYYRRGEKYVKALNEYGYINWYDWSCANWGTKWNACDSYINPDHTEVQFQTAWNYPEPVIEKILKDNPNAYITFSWKNEDYDGDHYIERSFNGIREEYTEWNEESEEWDE